MSENEFNQMVRYYRRRLELLALARKGSVDVKRVKVRTYTVREHTVSAHTRVYFHVRNGA